VSPPALAAALLAGAAVGVAAWPAGAAPAARLRRLTGPHRPPARSRARGLALGGVLGGQQRAEVHAATTRGGLAAGRLRLVVPVLAAGGVLALLPTVLGLLLAAGVGAAAQLFLPRLVPPPGRPAPVPAVDLPPVLDLLAACLAAGAPLRSALAVVGEAVPPPLGPLLRTAAGALALGSAPAAAFAGLSGNAGLERLADVLARAAATGTAPADQLTALAQDTRRAAQDSARAAARRAGVLVVLPLGLCFLPAFVLLGVVPVVAGVADQVLP
jgi:Flp pilus assembly protein TadB